MINSNYFKKSLVCSLSLIFLLGFVLSLSAKSIAILTSGGDNSYEVNEWRKNNIDAVETKLKEMGVNDCRQALDKKTFESHIEKASQELNSGDELVLYFNGHGGVEKKTNAYFVFAKADHGSEDRFLSIAEVRKLLAKLKPGVKVYIAVHSCYSGTFIEGLEKDPHVAVAVSSSGEQVAHRYVETQRIISQSGNTLFENTWVNWRNWPDGFAEGLKGENLAEAFQKGAQQGKKDAIEKGQSKKESFLDNPLDFKRGHLEKVENSPEGMKCTLKVGEGNVIVIIPRGETTNILGLSTSELQKCFDIEISGKAEFTRDGLFKPTTVKVIKFSGKFQVVEVPKKKSEIDNKTVLTLKANMVKPDGLKNVTQTIYVDKDDPVWKDLEKYQWYTFDGEVFESKIVGTNLKRVDPDPCSLGGHVESVDRDKKTFKVAIDTPKEFKGSTREAAIKEGENLPLWLQYCLMVDFEGVITKETLKDVTNIRVREETFVGTIKSIDGTGTKFTVLIKEQPNRYTNQIKEVEARPKITVPKNAKPGNKIYFHGKCYGKEVKDAHDINVISQETKTEKKLYYGMNIKPGWTSWGLGDFATSAKTLKYMGKEYPCMETIKTKEISGSASIDIGIYIAYHLGDTKIVGLDLGYRNFPGGTFVQGWSSHIDAMTQKLKLSASEIPVEFFYKQPIKKGLPLLVKLTGGFSFCRARIAYDYNLQYFKNNMINRSPGIENHYSRGNLKDSNLGLHFSLGAEYILNKKMSLTFDAGWVLARFKKLTGALIDQLGNSTQSLLTMENNPFGELLGHRSLADLVGSGARPAVVDLSGIRLSLGFQYSFDIPFFKKITHKKPGSNEIDLENKEPEIK